MIVKTYGVPGLSEWHGKLKVGSIETTVSFVGGTSSPSGSLPAYMTTKDPIAQFVIENSKEFKDGFIILMHTQEVVGVHPRMAVAKSAPANASQPSSDVIDADDAANVKTINVASKNDAVEWLKEHCPEKNHTAYSLRGKEAFAAACKEAGVEFIIDNA